MAIGLAGGELQVFRELESVARLVMAYFAKWKISSAIGYVLTSESIVMNVYSITLCSSSHAAILHSSSTAT